MTQRGSAVLVHGTWSSPADWHQVEHLLVDAGVLVTAVDLPSHRSSTAGLADDATSVRAAIRSTPAPVVVVGWSYGGRVISIAADGEPQVVRLVYVAAIPAPFDEGGDATWLVGDPHIELTDEGTFVLDNDWWLGEDTGKTFPPEILDHCRRHPRRPASLASETEAQTAAAWRSIPTTVLLGRDDVLVPRDQQEQVAEEIADVRVLDSDHFIIFREPAALAATILDALDDDQA